MQGYEIDIRNDTHRRNLIKDSRFYNLRHLTETLVPAKLYHNPFRGNAAELLLNVNDFRASNSRVGWVEGQPYGWMEYKRAHEIDKEPRDLVIQIEDDGIVVGGSKILLINRQAVKPLTTLKECAEGRKTEPHFGPLNGGKEELAVRIDIPDECFCQLDGVEREHGVLPVLQATSSPAIAPENGEESPVAKKRKMSESGSVASLAPSAQIPQVWILKRSLWRIKIRGQPPPPPALGGSTQLTTQSIGGGKRTMILVGVKLEGWTREKEFSREIPWL